MAPDVNKTMKVGIISCSGEELPEGTISRQATRRVLESLRPHDTVTICLPLFLAGNEGERNFARTHPTVTIDGCTKQCAKHATERLSGPVTTALVVSEIFGGQDCGRRRSTRGLTDDDHEVIHALAQRIATEVDALLVETDPGDVEADPAADVEAATRKGRTS